MRYDTLKDAAEAELAERGLQVLEQQVNKVVQLHEVHTACCYSATMLQISLA